MKSYIQFLPIVLALVFVPAVAKADAYSINDNPGYIKHVTIQNHIGCAPSYEYTFTCEHYLEYGESIAFVDGPEGDNCWHTYTVVSTVWVPQGLPLVGFENLHPGYSFATVATGRDNVAAYVHNNLGITIDNGVQYVLDQGCVGLYKLFLRVTLSATAHRYPGLYTRPELETTNPIFGTQVAFLDLAKAMAYAGCGANTHKVIGGKFGRWKDGHAPTPDSNFMVPADSIIDWSPEHNFDYFVYNPNTGKWLTMNNGYDPINHPELPPPEIHQFDNFPGPHSEYQGPIFIVRCVPDP